jgi:hypothetical protein|tara:strand:- start:1587 stop:1775 length:189 start_codon:yes stop_codon:yes gene_type:complete
MEPSPLAPLLFIGIKNDLDQLLESIKGNPDLDIYQQRTILRNGIMTISERMEKAIDLLDSDN